jgi:hypothetical protein
MRSLPNRLNELENLLTVQGANAKSGKTETIWGRNRLKTQAGSDDGQSSALYRINRNCEMLSKRRILGQVSEFSPSSR